MKSKPGDHLKRALNLLSNNVLVFEFGCKGCQLLWFEVGCLCRKVPLKNDLEPRGFYLITYSVPAPFKLINKCCFENCLSKLFSYLFTVLEIKYLLLSSFRGFFLEIVRYTKSNIDVCHQEGRIHP